jgi:hypothetical protein
MPKHIEVDLEKGGCGDCPFVVRGTPSDPMTACWLERFVKPATPAPVDCPLRLRGVAVKKR